MREWRVRRIKLAERGEDEGGGAWSAAPVEELAESWDLGLGVGSGDDRGG